MQETPASPHAQPAPAVCRALGVDPSFGLAVEEAAARLRSHGRNLLPARRPPTRLALLGRQLTNAMVVLLVGAAAISLAIGEPLDAAVILAIVVANALLGYVQEGRAEEAARGVRKLLTPTARVLRGGEASAIGSDSAVPGDVVLLRAGDSVPADGRLLNADRLEIDESLLTGESGPISKRAEPPVAQSATVAEQRTMAFTGCTVTRGSGRMIVTATGMATQVGQIAEAAEAVEAGPTPLQARLDRLASFLLRAALMVASLLTLLSWIHGEEIGDALLVGVSLAVAAVPEGLPAVVTITLAVGMRRMAERGAIVRRLRAVETLGSATVICADKTGTLTENRMRVERLYDCRARVELGLEAEGSDAASVLEAALLASENGLARTRAVGEPTEAAIAAAAARLGVDVGRGDRTRVVQVEPFDSERKLMSVVLEAPDGKRTAYAKGAPEAMMPRLADGADGERLAGIVERWASDGVRVLLVGRRSDLAPGADPERELEPLGLIGLTDPPRRGARPSVLEARAAGIRTVMITGDHPVTALAIARATAIAGAGGEAEVISGPDLDRLSDRELELRARSANVYARVTPAHKLRIVGALRAQGEVVAMTGDGVNDVPALRAAHIGVAMGRRGSDAASSAADIVLSDDDYSTIVQAVRRGRAIYDNIQRFVLFLLSANAGEALMFALAVTLGLSAPLTVLQILMVNLLTDGLPAIALGVDPPSRDVMSRAPRRPGEGLLDRIKGRLVLGGMAVGLAGFASYLVGLDTSHELGQTMAFTTLVFAQLTYVFGVRGDQAFFLAGANRQLVAAVIVSAAVQVAVLVVDPLADRFGVVAMSARELLVALALALLPLVSIEIFKAYMRRR